MPFHVTLNPKNFTLDEALLYLRSRLYEDDRKAVAALFITRPDLVRATVITDYIWNHLGQRLFDPLREGLQFNAVDVSILERLPPAETVLNAITADPLAPEDVRDTARQIVGRLRAHQGLAQRENDMARQEDLDDLFGPAQTEEEQATAGARQRTLRLSPVEAAPRSRIVEFAGNDVNVRAALDNDGGRLHLTATLMNLLDVAVEFNELQIILRRPDGTLLDCVPHYLNSRFKRAQEIVAELQFGAGVLEDVGQIDIRANFNFEFRTRLATATVLDAPPTATHLRQPWRFEVETVESPPGYPDFDLTFTGYHGAGYDEFCEFILQIVDLTPSSDLTRETVVALRDRDGKVLAKETHWGTYPVGTPTIFKIAPYLDGKKLRSVHAVDIAIKGNCRRHELIGAFTVLD